jgi:hypothetical protein
MQRPDDRQMSAIARRSSFPSPSDHLSAIHGKSGCVAGAQWTFRSGESVSYSDFGPRRIPWIDVDANWLTRTLATRLAAIVPDGFRQTKHFPVCHVIENPILTYREEYHLGLQALY